MNLSMKKNIILQTSIVFIISRETLNKADKQMCHLKFGGLENHVYKLPRV